MSVRIRPVEFGRAARPFMDLPWRIYHDDPVWVPQLRSQLAAQLDPAQAPFLRYGRAQLFLAERDGEPVGRISAHINPVHDATHHERGGFFGFFECINDLAVARVLFTAAEEWLASQDVEWVRGPLSFTMNDEVGLLIDGFDTPPVIGMPHGRTYYPALIESCGYHKIKDVVALAYDVRNLIDRNRIWHERITRMPGVRVREFDTHQLQRDVRIAAEIFNDAWSDNWGFVPISEAEADHLATDLARFIDPGLTAIVEIGGEPAGMVVAIPNINEVIRDLNGRLFPFGWIKAKWRLWRGPRAGRVILLGVKKAYRRRDLAGFALMLHAEVHFRGERQGYEWAELGWILEDNYLMRTSLERSGARAHKTYRIYQKALTTPSTTVQQQ